MKKVSQILAAIAIVLLAGIGMSMGAETQATANVAWNHGDLKVTSSDNGSFSLMMAITNSAGEWQDATASPVVLKAGDNIVGIPTENVEHIADGKTPLQKAAFWIEQTGVQISNKLVVP